MENCRLKEAAWCMENCRLKGAAWWGIEGIGIKGVMRAYEKEHYDKEKNL